MTPPPAAGSRSAAACRDGEIELRDLAGRVQRVCADTALAGQNGSRRRYRFAVDGGAYLLIDTTDGRPQRVEWGHQSPEYGCDGAACSGLAFARPDFNGRQAITLDDTRLEREAPADGGQDAGPLLLRARLGALGHVGAACDTGVTVNFSDNSYTRFCAFGGNGYAQGDDGLPVYSFSDIDGGLIQVRTDRAGQITGVAMPADGLRCVVAACTGVSFSPPDARGARVLALIGTTLHSADGSRAATLNGQLLLNGD